MESSIIHDLLSKELYDYYEQLANEEDRDLATIKELRSQMEKLLTEEQLKLADKYKHECILREEYIGFQMQVRILNYGIKMGMELQEAFNKYFDK